MSTSLLQRAKTNTAAGMRQGGAAVKGERAKVSYYNGFMSTVDRRHRFVPFVLETHGAWGREAECVVQYFSKLGEQRCIGMDKRDFKGRFRLLVALALMRGNARVQQDGVRMQLRPGDGSAVFAAAVAAVRRR